MSGWRLRWGLAVLGMVACKNPPPTCAAGDEEYPICSDDRIWLCPRGTPEQIAAKQAIEDACNAEDDPVQCLLDAEFEQVETQLVEDCTASDQVCEDVGLGPVECVDPA